MNSHKSGVDGMVKRRLNGTGVDTSGNDERSGGHSI